MDKVNDGIIVIGTSLGGLHALRVILKGLPKEFPLPLAIVQHRDKNSENLFDLFLKAYCAMEIIEVCDKEMIIPGRVYIAPANYHLLVEDGWFSLSTGPQVCYSRPSINVLFESAAYVYGKNTIGIILTGANQDGGKGLKTIKKFGGFTIAQDPRTAESSSMIDNAISLNVIDKIIPLESISKFLVELCCTR